MLWSGEYNLYKCDICGREEYGLPIITTSYLEPEPSPIICEKCFFEKLTGKKFIWNKRTEEFFLKNRIKKTKR